MRATIAIPKGWHKLNAKQPKSGDRYFYARGFTAWEWLVVHDGSRFPETNHHIFIRRNK